MKRIKALVDKIKDKFTIENWTLFLLVVGLPLLGLIYVDWKLALVLFVLTNIGIGILSLRSNK